MVNLDKNQKKSDNSTTIKTIFKFCVLILFFHSRYYALLSNSRPLDYYNHSTLNYEKVAGLLK